MRGRLERSRLNRSSGSSLSHFRRKPLLTSHYEGTADSTDPAAHRRTRRRLAGGWWSATAALGAGGEHRYGCGDLPLLSRGFRLVPLGRISIVVLTAPSPADHQRYRRRDSPDQAERVNLAA